MLWCHLEGGGRFSRSNSTVDFCDFFLRDLLRKNKIFLRIFDFLLPSVCSFSVSCQTQNRDRGTLNFTYFRWWKLWFFFCEITRSSFFVKKEPKKIRDYVFWFFNCFSLWTFLFEIGGGDKFVCVKKKIGGIRVRNFNFHQDSSRSILRDNKRDFCT